MESLQTKQKVLNKFNLSKDVHNLFLDFLNSVIQRVSDRRIREYTSFMEAYLENRIPSSINDFSYETLLLDLKITNDDYRFSNGRCLNPTIFGNLKNLYIFVKQQGYGDLESISFQQLNYHNLIKRVKEGYEFITVDTYKDIPRCDKWLLTMENTIKEVDFTSITNEYKRNIMKKYFWLFPTPKNETKCQRLGNYTIALNSIADALPLKLEFTDAKNIKDALIAKDLSSQSLFVGLSSIRTLFAWMKSENFIDYNNTTIKYFSTTNARSEGKTEHYSDEEIKAILETIRSDISNEENEIVKSMRRVELIAILYAINTAMRMSTILKLKISDLIETSPNTFIYIADSKRQQGEKYNISPDVKKLHDELIDISSSYRNNDSNFKNDLFIIQRVHGRNTAPLTLSLLNCYLNDVCERSNVRKLKVTGLRNRFMDKIMKTVNGGNETEKLISATRHSAYVHYNNYYAGELESIAESMYNVTIGNVNLLGIVVETPTNSSKESIVMNGIGQCSKHHCEENNALDCLMCKSFVCSPINIPYFESEIRELESKILNETIPHEIEFLLTKKQLYVKYLVECYKKKGEVDYVNSHIS